MGASCPHVGRHGDELYRTWGEPADSFVAWGPHVRMRAQVGPHEDRLGTPGDRMGAHAATCSDQPPDPPQGHRGACHATQPLPRHQQKLCACADQLGRQLMMQALPIDLNTLHAQHTAVTPSCAAQSPTLSWPLGRPRALRCELSGQMRRCELPACDSTVEVGFACLCEPELLKVSWYITGQRRRTSAECDYVPAG